MGTKSILITIFVTAAVVFVLGWFVSKYYYKHHPKELYEKRAVVKKSPSSSFQWCWDPGYPWTVPRVSLPSALGLLPQYQVEWWFYVGYLMDDAGILYTVEFTIVRVGLAAIGQLPFQVVKGGCNIGNDRVFKNNESYGKDISYFPGKQSLYAPVVTDDVFEVTFKPNLLGKDNVSAKLIDGIVGQPGTTYSLLSKGKDYLVDLIITDVFGSRMEGANGFVSDPNVNSAPNSSYEFCFPWHNVNGGKIKFDGRTSNVKDGWIWLDRQVVTYRDGSGPLGSLTEQHIKKKPKMLNMLNKQKFRLYTGNWIAVVLPQTNCSFYVACGWPEISQQGHQWVVGSDLKRSAIWSIGAVWTPYGTSPGGYNVGGNMPNFTINITHPENPDISPHWVSPESGITYCSAWRVDFAEQLPGMPNRTFWIHYFRPDCEIDSKGTVGSPYMEGAAHVFMDPKGEKHVGWAWVEQMGMN